MKVYNCPIKYRGKWVNRDLYSKKAVDKLIKQLETELEDEREERLHAESLLLGTHGDEPGYYELTRDLAHAREVAASLARRAVAYLTADDDARERLIRGVEHDLERGRFFHNEAEEEAST